MFKYLSIPLILALAGCAIGPDYVRPTTEAPKTFREEAAHPAASFDAQWWNNFHDAKLNAAVEAALNANFDLRSARMNVESMLGQFDQANSYLYPQLNGTGSLTRKSVENATAKQYNLKNGVTSTYAASLSLATYEIDLFGKVRRANEAARSLLLSSEYAKDTVKLSVSAGVASSYIKLASLKSQIDLAQENLKASNDILEMTDLKYRYGVISESVLLQAQSESENARATLSQLQAAKITEETTFNLLLGRNPQNVDTSGLESIAVPNVPEALPSTLLTHRPDVATAEQNLVAANAKIGIAKAAYFPSIKLTGMLGVQSLELSNFTSNPARIWELAPSVSVPLFTAGLIDGQFRTAKADYEKSLADYQKAVVNAFNDTDNALGQTERSKEQLTMQEKRSALMDKAYEQARLRYKSGTISYTDLLIVQQQWLQSRQNALIARQNSLISLVSLYKALGGGWENNPSSLASAN